MPAQLIYRKQKLEVQPGMMIRAALEKLEIQPETVIPTRKGEIISEEEVIREGDVIRLVKVIAGG